MLVRDLYVKLSEMIDQGHHNLEVVDANGDTIDTVEVESDDEESFVRLGATE